MAAITFDNTHRAAGRLEAVPPAALDAGIVSDAIPAFFIGRNKDGFWVARDTKGLIGGIFLLEASAVSFARTQAGPGGCATIFPTERFELDLENNGNPLIGFFRLLMRLALHLRRRAHALATGPPEPGRAGGWREGMGEADLVQFEAEAGALLAELGYDVAS